MVKMGFGKQGLKSGARGGFLIGFLILSAFNIADLVLKDDYNWKHFVSAMAVDVGILTISTAAGIAAGVGVAIGFGVAAFTVGPILVAIGVSIGVGLALNYAAEQFRLREKLVKALTTMSEAMSNGSWDGSPIMFEGDSRRETFLERVVSAFGANTPKIRGYGHRRR